MVNDVVRGKVVNILWLLTFAKLKNRYLLRGFNNNNNNNNNNNSNAKYHRFLLLRLEAETFKDFQSSSLAWKSG